MASTSRNHTSLFSVHLGNLRIGTTKAQLINLFNDVGQVENVYIRDYDEALSRSKITYGFVRYKTIEECDNAIDIFNDWPLNGCNIRVSFAREQPHSGVNSHRLEERSTATRSGGSLRDNDIKYDERYLSTLKYKLKTHGFEDDISYLLEELETIKYGRVELFQEAPPDPYVKIDFDELSSNISKCYMEEQGLTVQDMPEPQRKLSIGRLYTESGKNNHMDIENKDIIITRSSDDCSDNEIRNILKDVQKTKLIETCDMSKVDKCSYISPTNTAENSQLSNKLNDAKKSSLFNEEKESTSLLNQGVSTSRLGGNLVGEQDFLSIKPIGRGRGILMQKLFEERTKKKSPVGIGRSKALFKQIQDANVNSNNNNNILTAEVETHIKPPVSDALSEQFEDACILTDKSTTGDKSNEVKVKLLEQLCDVKYVDKVNKKGNIELDRKCVNEENKKDDTESKSKTDIMSIFNNYSTMEILPKMPNERIHVENIENMSNGLFTLNRRMYSES